MSKKAETKQMFTLPQKSVNPEIYTESPVVLHVDPLWDERVSQQLDEVLLEHAAAKRLLKAGLQPIRKILLTGPPGVGKTLAARWLASKLSMPFLLQNISQTISSQVGGTGRNLSTIFGIAEFHKGVLLLDEIDAIGGKRIASDSAAATENSRIVLTLLQQIDLWRGEGILVAATNHVDFLDPALLRRFDIQIDFPLPDVPALRAAAERFLGPDVEQVSPFILDWLATALLGKGIAELERICLRARRQAIVHQKDLSAALQSLLEAADV